MMTIKIHVQDIFVRPPRRLPLRRLLSAERACAIAFAEELIGNKMKSNAR